MVSARPPPPPSFSPGGRVGPVSPRRGLLSQDPSPHSMGLPSPLKPGARPHRPEATADCGQALPLAPPQAPGPSPQAPLRTTRGALGRHRPEARSPVCSLGSGRSPAPGERGLPSWWSAGRSCPDTLATRPVLSWLSLLLTWPVRRPPAGSSGPNSESGLGGPWGCGAWSGESAPACGFAQQALQGRGGGLHRHPLPPAVTLQPLLAGGPQGLPAELPGGGAPGTGPSDTAAPGLRGSLRPPAPASQQLRAQVRGLLPRWGDGTQVGGPVYRWGGPVHRCGGRCTGAGPVHRWGGWFTGGGAGAQVGGRCTGGGPVHRLGDRCAGAGPVPRALGGPWEGCVVRPQAPLGSSFIKQNAQGSGTRPLLCRMAR